MDWETLEAALRAVLSGGGSRLGVEFTGGEPLLQISLLQRAVRYVERHRPRSMNVSFSLSTNGTLLTARLASWLFTHDFKVRLSFDGLPAAQNLRGPGTFPVLDRFFDVLRSEFPTQLRKSVTVSTTLVASAIPALAASIRYLMDKGVAEIAIAPRLTWDPEWSAQSRDRLQEQVNEILAFSADHWRRTRELPVGFLARPPVRDTHAPVGEFLCVAPTGSCLAVDPDGRAFACPLFVDSLATLPALARKASPTLYLGDAADPTVLRRLASLPRKANRLRIFTDKVSKRSSYGACADCRFVADCRVCPASICHIPGNRDPDLVPDFICAFNQVTLAARERFDGMTGGEPSDAWYAEVRGTLDKIAEAITSATGQARGGSAHAGGQRSRERKTPLTKRTTKPARAGWRTRPAPTLRKAEQRGVPARSAGTCEDVHPRSKRADNRHPTRYGGRDGKKVR